MKWISVKDKLPETNNGWSGPVLVFTVTGIVEISDFNKGSQNDIWSWLGLGSYEVTHWMPLPEPPKP